MEELKNIYGHPCVRVYRTVKGSTVVTYVELHKLVASKLPWYDPKKQVLFKDMNGLNLDPENLTQDWKEVKFAGKERPVVATYKDKPVVFESIKACAEAFGLKPMYVSQALSRGTNIGRLFIEYYFGTLPEEPVVQSQKKVPKKKAFKVSVDGVGFYRMKDAAEYLGILPNTLSIYLREGQATVKGKKILKLK